MITVDSNVVVYTCDNRDADKQVIAFQVMRKLEQLGSPLGLQVVGEVHNVLRRKLRVALPVAAEKANDLLDAFPTFTPTEPAARLALKEAASGYISYWDALLRASAAEAGCTVMVTEDLQDGARLFGLMIANPFYLGGISPRAAELLDLS